MTDVSTTCAVVTLTLKMTTAQVVETSVTVNSNSPIQDYVHPDDQIQEHVGNMSVDVWRRGHVDAHSR